MKRNFLTEQTVANGVNSVSYGVIEPTTENVDDLFNVVYSGTDEAALSALNKALQLWSEKIFFTGEITIELQPDASLSADVAFNTVVTYATKSDSSDKVFYPTALLRQQGLYFSGSDISIRYNSDMSLWSFDENSSSGKYDFTTAMLRALAKGFGFGTGLNGADGNIGFRFPQGYSMAYDKFVVDAFGHRLSEQEPHSDELSSFVKNPAYFNINNKDDYRLFTPQVFDRNVSLCYFDDTVYDEEKALMYPECAAQFLYIGDKVVDVLSALGWLKNPDAEIVSGSVPESGVVDYRQGLILSFACNMSDEVSEYSWVYEVRTDGGGYYEVSASSSPEFSFQLPEYYDIVSNGDVDGNIESRVRLNAVVGGVAKELLFPVLVRGGRLVRITGVERQPDNPDCCDVGFRFYTSQPGRFIRYFDIWGVGGVVEGFGYLESGMHEFTVKDVYYDLDYVLSLSRTTDGVVEQGMDIPVRIDSQSGVKNAEFSRYLRYLPDENILRVSGETVKLCVYNMGGVLLKNIMSAGEYELGEINSGVYVVRGIIDGEIINLKFIKL